MPVDKTTPYTMVAWSKNGEVLKHDRGHTQEVHFYKDGKRVLKLELDRSNAIKLAMDLITTGMGGYDPKKENFIVCPCKPQ